MKVAFPGEQKTDLARSNLLTIETEGLKILTEINAMLLITFFRDPSATIKKTPTHNYERGIDMFSLKLRAVLVMLIILPFELIGGKKIEVFILAAPIQSLIGIERIAVLPFHGGLSFVVVKKEGDWYKLKLLGGKEGYIHRKMVEEL